MLRPRRTLAVARALATLTAGLRRAPLTGAA
jgi:hypothetical protein